MFAETAVALILIGLLIGGLVAAWLVELLRCDPLREHNQALRQQQASRSWDAEKDAISYQAFKNAHRGTPYIAPDPSAFERLIVAIADPEYSAAGGSFRADLPENVRRIGVSR